MAWQWKYLPAWDIVIARRSNKNKPIWVMIYATSPNKTEKKTVIQLLSPMNGVQTLRNFIIWRNPRAGKIKRILCSYWQPKPFLLSRDISRWSRKKNVLVLAMMNPLLTKLFQSRYLDIGLVLFCVFIDLDFFSVHKKRQKMANIQPSWPHAWSITDIEWILVFYQ